MTPKFAGTARGGKKKVAIPAPFAHRRNMTTHLARQIEAILAERKMTKTALARQLDCANSTITRILLGEHTPDWATLRSLCTTWEIPETGLLLLRAHLHDEVERCGRSLEEVTIMLGDALGPDAQAAETRLRELDGDLHLINRHLRDSDVHTMVRYIADVLRTEQSSDLRAAEDADQYNSDL